MDDTPAPLDPGLRLLKWLVIALTASMCLGVVAVVAAVLLRLPAPAPALPDALELPAGAQVESFTRGRDFVAVVTRAGEILIYAPDGATLRQRIAVE